jgi:hypothetical protein
LPVPGDLPTARNGERIQPRNPRERQLAGICAEVLGMEVVGILDSLFELGADSVQVFQIVARANDAGLALTPTQVLSGRTVAIICEELDKAAAPAASGPPLTAVARDRFRMERAQLEIESAHR